ncbi:hypothetical protein NKH18_06915 [Streptomyces sp. M10(2022)]
MTTAMQPEVPEGRNADPGQRAHRADARPTFAPARRSGSETSSGS